MYKKEHPRLGALSGEIIAAKSPLRLRRFPPPYKGGGDFETDLPPL